MAHARLSLLIVFCLITRAAWAEPYLDVTGPNRRLTSGLDRTVVLNRAEVKRQGAAEWTLLDAAVAADPELTANQQRLQIRMAHQRLRALAQRIETADTEAARARLAFLMLHSDLLIGRFDPLCARLSRTLELGDFNCLTGTILYLELCQKTGVRASAVASPGHVCVRIWLENAAYDVETTAQAWNPQPVERAAELMGVIDSRALLGRVYYNLGIGLASQGNFQQALQMTRTSCDLDPSHLEAKANLLATINNWSIDLMRQGELDRADALIQEGLQLDANYQPLQRTDAYLLEQRRLDRTH